MNRMQPIARSGLRLWAILPAVVVLAACPRPAAAQFAFFSDAFTNLGTLFSPEYTGPVPAPNEAIQFYYDAPPGWAISDVFVRPSSSTTFRTDVFIGLFVDQGFLTTSLPGVIANPAVDLTPTQFHISFPLTGNPKGNGAFFQPRIVNPLPVKNAEIVLCRIDTLAGDELLGPAFDIFGNGVTAAELLSPPATTPAEVSALFVNLDDPTQTMTLSGPYTVLGGSPFIPDIQGFFASAVITPNAVPEPGTLPYVTAGLAIGCVVIIRRKRAKA